MATYSSTQETLNDAASIGLPILFLVIAIGSFVWFGIEIRQKRILMKAMVGWFIINILYTLCMVYLLIVSALHLGGIEAPNVFNIVASKLFGIEIANGKQWIIVLILSFITYILIKTLANSIKIARLEHAIDELNKNVAILGGKVNKTLPEDQTKPTNSDKKSNQTNRKS